MDEATAVNAAGSASAPPPAAAARLPLRLALFGVLAVAAVFFGFVAPDVATARELVQRAGYYTIALTFAWAVVAFVRVAPAWWREGPPLSRRAALGSGLTVLALTLLAVLTVPFSYKVLYDEFVLQNTALNLHQLREVGTTVRGYEIEGVFTALGSYLDKRPYFFAFLVSLLHDLTGYREANAFALNTALLPVVLALAGALARRLMAARAAWAAVVAFGAFSLLAHNAVGAGMEMLNLAMLLVVVLLAVHYLAAPDGARLAALVLAAVLLAQTRYESSLYIAPTALVILEGWRRAGRILLPPAALLAPVLLIPYAWHNTYLSGTPLLWELREGTESRFGVEFLGGNLERAAAFFFDFSGRIMNSWWLGVAGLPAFAWVVWRAVRGLRGWRHAPAAEFTALVFAGAVTANLGLLMFYYWGALDDPIVSRLSLPFSGVLALSLGWVATQVPERWRERAVLIVAGGALLSYQVSGLRSNAHHWEQNLLLREIAWEADMIAALPPANRLLISNKSPLFWLGRELPAISTGRARWRAEGIKFHLEHHTFQEILVLQTLRPVGADGGFQIDPADRLPDHYVLEPLTERRFGVRLARISRVREIRLDAATTSTLNPPTP